MLGERGRRLGFPVRDHDANFSRSFDDVFRSEGGEVVVTPVRAPTTNAYAQRWAGTVRAECLDWLLIVGRGHLETSCRSTSSTTTGTVHIGRSGLKHQTNPPARLTVVGKGQPGVVHRRDLLGGLLHQYRRTA